METDLLLALLCGLGVFVLLKKNKSTEAQAENLETKEKLLELEKELIKTKATLESEEIKRDEIKKEMTEKVNETLTPKDIADYFNRNK
ncbi:MAG: hypothetical protein EBR01_14195 [Proteobacteria bacterium]|jgi:hypothetical protein|nr:hypothetical protein [Pseudomonadota bacterium]